LFEQTVAKRIRRGARLSEVEGERRAGEGLKIG